MPKTGLNFAFGNGNREYRGSIPYFLYLGSVVLGVLAFGAIHTWAYTLVFLGTLAASLLLIRHDLFRKGPTPSLRWVKTDLTPLFLMFVAFLLLQMLPLPRGLLLLISPEAKIDGDMSLPAASALDPAALKGHWHALAPYLYPVRMSLIRWIFYGLLFFGLTRCLNSRRRIETAIAVLLALGVFEALYGIVETYSGHNHVWWYEKTTHLREISGTYLNRNHFAGFMEMGITLTVAYAAALGGRRQANGRATGNHHPLRSSRRRFLDFFSGRRELRRVLVVFAGGIMGLGLILSASRGGIIATAGALFLMGLLFMFRRDERRKGRIILALCGIALAYGLYAGLDYTIGRFDLFDHDLKQRGIMAQRTMDLFGDYKAFGVGLGNFRYASGRVQDILHPLIYFDYAHNDYAQFLAEAGIVGAILLLAGTGFYVVRTFKDWRGRSAPFAVCLGIAPFAALLALAIHSWSDFNLHRPANVMLLIAVIAIGQAALRLEEHHGDRLRQEERRIPLRWRGLVLLACGVGLIGFAGLGSIRHFIAESRCNTGINVTMNLDENPSPDEARSAMAWDPGNAGYPYKLALAMMGDRDRLMQQAEPDTAGWRRSHDPIIASLERAIRLNPFNAEVHVRLGWEYSYLWDRPDHSTRWTPAGDLCLERAAWFAGNWTQNPRLQYDMGNYWAMRARELETDSPKGDVAWIKAVWHYRKGMALEKRMELPDNTRDFLRNFITDEAHLRYLR